MIIRYSEWKKPFDIIDRRLRFVGVRSSAYEEVDSSLKQARCFGSGAEVSLKDRDSVLNLYLYWKKMCMSGSPSYHYSPSLWSLLTRYPFLLQSHLRNPWSQLIGLTSSSNFQNRYCSVRPTKGMLPIEKLWKKFYAGLFADTLRLMDLSTSDISK